MNDDIEHFVDRYDNYCYVLILLYYNVGSARVKYSPFKPIITIYDVVCKYKIKSLEKRLKK